MKLIIIHESKDAATSNGEGLLRFALSSEPIASVILDGLSPAPLGGAGRFFTKRGPNKVVCAIPKGWDIESASHRANAHKIITYTENVQICSEFQREIKRNVWFAVSDGRFATQMDSELLDKVLAGTRADVVTVNVKSELLAYREKVRLTTQRKVAGFRRLHSNLAEPAPVPIDWPHHIFVRTNVLDQVLVDPRPSERCGVDNTFPEAFSALLERCRSNALTLQAINIAGVTLDLETEDGLLNFCRTKLSKIRPPTSRRGEGKNRDSNVISQDSRGSPFCNTSQGPQPRRIAAGNPQNGTRFIGKVLLGKDVSIGPKVIVAGPTIIGDNVTIEQGSVINSSIIGPDVLVPPKQLVQNRVVKAPECGRKHLIRTTSSNSKQVCYGKLELSHQQEAGDIFRTWPRFSYARCLKRIADCLAAIIVLILFAPVIPFIALAIKLSSPGAVFFKDQRQGLHGKKFNCLKFRTMTVGADKIQEKLRIASEVDGPQFKMADDPRLSVVGRFLRETYIDEISQFFNVLLGQMSVVGPRPSPESENTLCPSWRDARLSVRPGITGLWQVCRTRQPMKDFQEWIHYDTKYVRDLSLRMDLWICWQTIKKMVENFVKQF